MRVGTWVAIGLALGTSGARVAPPAAGAPASALASAPAPVVVVVNAANPTPSLTRAQVARIFLKKVARWPSGAAALPADLTTDSPVRAAFTEAVLGKTMPSVRAYWHARIFTGRDLPPPEKGSEEDAIAFVGENPGAVSYVSARATLPPAVRALPVTE